VVDTLARSAVGVDENSSMEMGRFIDAIDHMRRDLNCSALIVHHTGKNGDIRGSTALRGACDSVMILSKQDAILKLSNNHDDGGKNKHDAEHPPIMVELVERAVSLHGVDYRSAVIMPAAAVIRSPKTSGRLTPSQRTILEFLDTADKAVKISEIVSGTNVSQAQIYRVIKELREAKYVTYNDELDNYLITDEGKKAWYGS
jgi:predicted transcriptional regulator